MLPDGFNSSMSSRNSNNPNGLRPRQQQHRRQNSTPVAFRAANVQKLPNHRQHAGHRRGLSLDIRGLQLQAAGQDFMVSTHTNSTGLANHSQHLLREAQQQRIQARPGNQNPYISLAPSGSDQNLISPLTTPQLQTDRFDSSCFGTNPLALASYGGDVNVNMMMPRTQNAYGDQIAGGRDFDLQLLNTDSALSTPTFATFQESPTAQGWTSEGDTTSTRRSPRRISNGIMDRVNKFETLGFDGLQRPITPPNQNASSPAYFPPTPMETPQSRLVKIEPRPSRFTDGYDESMEETIKPSRSRVNRRAQNIFQDIRQQSEQSAVNLLPASQSFDGLPLETTEYMNLAQFDQSFMKLEDRLSRPQESVQLDAYINAAIPDAAGSFNQDQTTFNDLDTTDLESPLYQQPSSESHTPMRNMSPARNAKGHSRAPSAASVASAASIASLNVDDAREDTGITLDEIVKYIQNPDRNNKNFKCLFPDCAKLFGRKENIKSHIQTHLGDRQYVCNCGKRFVRQHDLKRHAKIHTGVKPYPCVCGNTFARHDALTRHRQRGMCIGAFDDLPQRKKNKRGRPPKKRAPEDGSESASPSGAETSVATSPVFDFSNPEHVMPTSVNAYQMNMPIESTAPMVGLSSSPVAMTAQSYVSPEAIMSSHPTTPHHFNSPPGLTHSSTPPSLSFAELETNSLVSEMSGLSTSEAANPITMTDGMSDLHGDTLITLDNAYYFQNEGTSKFDDGLYEDIFATAEPFSL